METDVSIRIPLETYQDLCLWKISTGVPIGRQVADLVKGKKDEEHNCNTKSTVRNKCSCKQRNKS